MPSRRPPGAARGFAFDGTENAPGRGPDRKTGSAPRRGTTAYSTVTDFARLRGLSTSVPF